jgi:hypothetical protein
MGEDSTSAIVSADDADTGDTTGPRARRRADQKMSTRDYRGPRDLMRSRNVGLVRDVCSRCGVTRGPEGRTTHRGGCQAVAQVDPQPMRWVREQTGPITARQTSRDTGWTRVV